MSKIFLFDVSNIFYRAFYGNDRLSTTDGFPTQGLHGFIRTVHGIIRDHKPDYVAFAMEGGGINPRKLIEPLYKANRQAAPDDLKLQLAELPELLAAMNYPVFKHDGFEADDVIATLARKANSLGLQAVIVSTDKDHCQSVHEHTIIYNFAKDEFLTEESVYARYGVSVQQFTDYLAIVGDSSDNIKGVTGIGPKGAVELLNRYITLDGIYSNLHSIKPAHRSKLEMSRDGVRKAKTLVKALDVPLDSDLQLQVYCRYIGPDKDKLRSICTRFEFKELANMLLGAETVNLSGVEVGVRR